MMQVPKDKKRNRGTSTSYKTPEEAPRMQPMGGKQLYETATQPGPFQLNQSNLAENITSTPSIMRPPMRVPQPSQAQPQPFAAVDAPEPEMDEYAFFGSHQNQDVPQPLTTVDPKLLPTSQPSSVATPLRHGQPLRNDSSVSLLAEPNHEIDVDPKEFIDPAQPAESQGLGSRSAQANTGIVNDSQNLSGLERDIRSNVDRLANDPELQLPTGRVEPSRGRKILGNIAGFGLGALTMNPMVGQNVRNTILDEPTHRAMEEAQMRRAPIESTNAGLSGVHGLATKRMNEEASIGQANAAGTNANTTARKQQYDEKNPTYGTTGQKVKVGGKDVVQQFPDRPGAGEPITRGETPTDASSGQFEKSVAPDGTVSIINKSTNEAKVVTGTDGKPVIEGGQNAQQFDTYWKAYEAGDKNAMQAILRLVSAGAAQVGANIENETNRRLGREGEARSIAAEISRRVKAGGGGYAQARDAIGKLLTSQADNGGEFSISDLAKEIEAALKSEFPDWNKTPKRDPFAVPTK